MVENGLYSQWEIMSFFLIFCLEIPNSEDEKKVLLNRIKAREIGLFMRAQLKFKGEKLGKGYKYNKITLSYLFNKYLL